MLTGVVPFDDLSPASVALQHITQPPPPPRSLNPQLNLETEAVLLRALNKNPKERYQTGAALLEALEKALAGVKPTNERVLPLPPMPAAVLGGKTRTITRKVPPAPAKPAPKPRRWALSLAIIVLLLFAAIFVGNVLLKGGFSALFPALAPSVTPSQTWTPLPPATLTPLPSSSPTGTVTTNPTATHTLTPRPSATPTASATATITTTTTVTLSFTETATPAETSTLTVTPISTAALTAAPIPSVTTTPQYPNLKRLWLYYDQYGFYLYNASTDNRSISPIAFERADGANRFIGSTWAEFYPTLHPGRCMRIEIQGNPGSYLNPPLCKDYYLSTRSILETSDFIFWTEQPDQTQFHVFWQDEQVGVCEIETGFCEIFVP